MSKKYFVWKNGIKATDGVQDWEEISPNDFIEISKANKNLPTEEKRYFYRISQSERNDTYYFFECTYEQHKEYARAAMEKSYKRQKASQDEEYEKYQTISLDYEYVDDDGNVFTFHDLVPDVDSSVEDELITKISIKNVLSILSDDEYEIIYKLFLSENAVSERELARQMGLPQKTLNNTKKRIFQKIKKYLAQND